MIAGVITEKGHQARTVDIKDLGNDSPANYDAVVVGASIHVGKHDKHVIEFVEKNRDALTQMPSAFYSVSLAAHGDSSEAEGYVDEFEKATGWQPGMVALFGGALLYTQYGFFKRHLLKKIAKDAPGGLGTDMSRDYVYTEWDAVKRFAEHFVDQLEASPSAP